MLLKRKLKGLWVKKRLKSVILHPEKVLQTMKITFILNPISGTVKKAGIPHLIETCLDRSVYTYSIIYTEYAGHATELARQASASGADVVVAVGGDGTINEVGCGLLHTDTAMGILPCGSGNGLARHLRIPMNLRKAIDVLNRHEVRQLDYGMINGRPFFCTCGMGFDAFISKKFADGGKRGKLKYVQYVLQEGLRYPAEDYVITSDNGEQARHAYLVSVANASQYGNNAYIAPQATMTDGLLDVIIMKPFGVFGAPEVSFDMMNKTLNRSQRVETFRTRKLHIHREKEGPVHYDGDPVMMGTEIDIELVSKGIKMMINPEVEVKGHRPNGMQKSVSRLLNALVRHKKGK